MPLAQSHRRAAHWEIVQLSTNCRIAIEVETPSQLDGVFVQKLSCEKILPPAAFPWLCDAMYTRVAAVSFVPWRLEDEVQRDETCRIVGLQRPPSCLGDWRRPGSTKGEPVAELQRSPSCFVSWRLRLPPPLPRHAPQELQRSPLCFGDWRRACDRTASGPTKAMHVSPYVLATGGRSATGQCFNIPMPPELCPLTWPHICKAQHQQALRRNRINLVVMRQV